MMAANISSTLEASEIPSLDAQVNTVNEGFDAPLDLDTPMFLLGMQWVRKWEKISRIEANSQSEILESMDVENENGPIAMQTRSKSLKQHEKSTEHDNFDSNLRRIMVQIGPINNFDILETNGLDTRLKENLIEQTDYKMVPQDVWKAMVHWYGLEGPSIERQVISRRYGGLSVEVYPLEFILFPFEEPDKEVKISISRISTKNQLLQKILSLLKLDSTQEIRVWGSPDKMSKSAFTLYDLNDSDMILDDDTISTERYLMIEQKSIQESEWPANESEYGQVPKFSWACSEKNIKPDSSFSNVDKPINGSSLSLSIGERQRTLGTTGLNNLGNTCFMNSALQCLSNTHPLTEYFLSDKYKDDLNPSNPLGMNGEIAEAYGNLIHNLWNKSAALSYAPRDFKFTIGRFASQFVGYAQHDSQELLAFLLDGLHEDLNRIQKKPYIELPDYDGKISDHAFANELWKAHKARNDSVIVDHFQGQYKSTLVCPKCDNISIIFDPYMYLSLPIPVEKSTSFRFTYIPSDSTSECQSLMLQVPYATTFAKLMPSLGKKLNIDPKHLVIAEIFHSKVYKVFCDDDFVRDIMEGDDIIVYDLSNSVKGNKTYYLADGIFQGTKDEALVAIPVGFQKNDLTKSPFGQPFFIQVPRRIRKNDLLRELVSKTQRYTNANILNEFYSESSLDSIGKKMDVELDLSDSNMKADDGSWFSLYFSENGGYSRSLKEDEEGYYNLEEDFHLFLSFNAEKYEGYFGLGRSKFPKRVHNFHQERKQTDKTVDLYDCFRNFSQEERLGEQDAWYCPKCKEHQQATKKLDLWSVPEILVIHLKRFSHSRYRRDKIENLVEFPIDGLELNELTLSKTNIDLTYDLFAVDNHFGGLGGGHYTAYACNFRDKKWYNFDDAHVVQMNKEQVCTKNAYLLFYRRRGTT